MPDIRVEAKLRKQFTTEGNLVYNEMGDALFSAFFGVWKDVQKARNVESPTYILILRVTSSQ